MPRLALHRGRFPRRLDLVVSEGDAFAVVDACERALDADAGILEMYIRPLETRQLSASDPGANSEPVQGLESVT